jgi:hypothetical protein
MGVKVARVLSGRCNFHETRAEKSEQRGKQCPGQVSLFPRFVDFRRCESKLNGQIKRRIGSDLQSRASRSLSVPSCSYSSVLSISLGILHTYDGQKWPEPRVARIIRKTYVKKSVVFGAGQLSFVQIDQVSQL